MHQADDGSVDIATGYELGGPRFYIWRGQDIVPSSFNLIGSYQKGFPQGYSDRNAMLTVHTQLVPRWRYVELRLHSPLPYIFIVWCSVNLPQGERYLYPNITSVQVTDNSVPPNVSDSSHFSHFVFIWSVEGTRSSLSHV
jgi:hypothetical protein